MVLEDRQLLEGDGFLADLNLYFLVGKVPLMLVLYVDDLFLTGDEQLITDCKANLAAEFEMKDLGLYFTIKPYGSSSLTKECKIYYKRMYNIL